MNQKKQVLPKVIWEECISAPHGIVFYILAVPKEQCHQGPKLAACHCFLK